MNINLKEKIRRKQIEEDIKSQDNNSIKERVNRYLEIEHNGIIGGHYFSKASSECIYLYRDSYFIGTVMMSHAINEGIIKFVAERNSIQKKKHPILIKELLKNNIISEKCANASDCIWKSYRNDIHHMNPSVAEIPFEKLASQNLKNLAIIEKEIFSHDFKNGNIVPHQLKYWDIDKKGMIKVFLRLE